MDLPPFSHPTFLLSLAATIVGLIIWFVRLEAKTATNANNIERLEKELKEVYEDFDKHRLNQEIHFNLRISQQVEQGNERRFATIEKQLEAINNKLDKMAGK